MPDILIENTEEVRHTDDMQDIITAVPSWILRWGITVFFMVLVLIFSLSALIRYPDIVNASLKIVSPNAPKPVISKISGKLTRLLVHENETVSTGQALAYLESTGDHKAILSLFSSLKLIQTQLITGKPFQTSYCSKPICRNWVNYKHLIKLFISNTSNISQRLMTDFTSRSGPICKKTC